MSIEREKIAGENLGTQHKPEAEENNIRKAGEYERPDIDGPTAWYRFKQFLKGKNKAGRIAGMIKDIAISVLPYGDKIKTISAIIGNRAFNRGKNMETYKEKIIRYAKQPTTQAALGLIATVAGAIFSGVHIDVDVLTQSVVGIVTAIATIYTLAMNAYNMFRDEDKPKV